MSFDLKSLFPIHCTIIHIIGIGGIGMSGIAEILHNLGYQVQGSDLTESSNLTRLQKLGLNCFVGHKAVNIANATLVVVSSAVKQDNPEVIHARNNDIPIIHRKEMLAELMRFKVSVAVSGTHGKTTTTSIIAELFSKVGLQPTVINGGIINQMGTNAYLGAGDYLIAEADESDGTFKFVPAHIAVVTNINPEHLDYYKTFDNLKNAFSSFMQNIPFYGFVVACYDNNVVKELAENINNRIVLSYGINDENCIFKATNIIETDRGSVFDVEIAERYAKKFKLNFNKITALKLNIYGIHNVQNSLSAVAIAVHKRFDLDILRNALENFSGVKRRFTVTGEVKGVLIIDDYAHHPVEIQATLKTAKTVALRRNGNLIAIMQPHRYSRLSALIDDYVDSFSDADNLLIAKVYSAGEIPINQITEETLIAKIKNKHSIEVAALGDKNLLPSLIAKLANPNDVVIFLGAGDITKWAYALPEQLKAIYV